MTRPTGWPTVRLILRFAEVIRSIVRQGDMVWVQDYHLMLLPLMLRTLVEGSEQQGATSQRELEHVRHGVDGTLQLQDDDLLAAPSSDRYDAVREEEPLRRLQMILMMDVEMVLGAPLLQVVAWVPVTDLAAVVRSRSASSFTPLPLFRDLPYSPRPSRDPSWYPSL